jgi:hypothetical protein
MKKYSEMIKCECYSHTIEVDYMGDPDEITYLNIWYVGKGNNNTPLLERIQTVWLMLTKGYVIDGVLLSKEKATKLRDALTIILDDKDTQK